MKLFTAMFTTVALLGSTWTEAQTIDITRAGSRPVRRGPMEHFTGSVRVEMLFDARGPSHASGGSVTFEPGARTAWHAHPRGQILIVTAGIGRVQRWGDPIEEIRAGDVVRIPAGQKHWHGASPQASMTHIAMTEHRDGTAVTWMEKVTDEQYTAAPKPRAAGPQGTSRPSGERQQRIAPGLAALTDEVLFGDVWRRPDLSLRDRSLVTISVLIATGKPAQLRGHLARASTTGSCHSRADGAGVADGAAALDRAHSGDDPDRPHAREHRRKRRPVHALRAECVRSCVRGPRRAPSGPGAGPVRCGGASEERTAHRHSHPPAGSWGIVVRTA